jgi:alkylated DNA repair protein (DNA oxidative demethylase)
VRHASGETLELFADTGSKCAVREPLADGAFVLRRFAFASAGTLLRAIHAIAQDAPFRHMVTPGGHRMSVAMTNCGALGWLSDVGGYRYSAIDPDSRRSWPSMPDALAFVASTAAAEAGFAGFAPDACLLNRYAPGTKLTLHQDKNERDMSAPIVSISLGLPAQFLFGGLRRSDRISRVLVHHGDAVVWGGPARLSYHAVSRLKQGFHPQTGEFRFNLTFRKAG